MCQIGPRSLYGKEEWRKLLLTESTGATTFTFDAAYYKLFWPFVAKVSIYDHITTDHSPVSSFRAAGDLWTPKNYEVTNSAQFESSKLHCAKNRLK